jgi:hypothetical protein
VKIAQKGAMLTRVDYARLEQTIDLHKHAMVLQFFEGKIRSVSE